MNFLLEERRLSYLSGLWKKAFSPAIDAGF